MINANFVREYNELVSGVRGNLKKIDEEIKKIEEEYNVLTVKINSGEIVYIDFDFEKCQNLFAENKINFVIGYSMEGKAYLFKIEKMFHDAGLNINNASLFPLLIDQGLSFRYLSDDKIIMKVSYGEGYSSDDAVEIYKTYEYNSDAEFDRIISTLNTLNNGNIEILVPLLFKKGQVVANGRELWESAMVGRRQ